MSKAVVINGSPRMEKGDTAMLLAPFVEGMTEAGCGVELVYASRLRSSRVAAARCIAGTSGRANAA